MILEPVHCPDCDGTDIIKNGKSPEGKQRYCCRNPNCARHSFILDYTYQAYLPQVKQKVVDMTLRGSGIRDVAENLKISTTTVLEILKKEHELESVNRKLIEQLRPTSVDIVKHVEAAELDEMGRFVGSKKQQRWLWHAIDHQTGQILAYVLADHKDEAFRQLQALLEPFGIQHFYKDG